ncbi:MAG TPA: M56 family metallopeptidase, partial [Holophaga sp.]|nr:M56 family metallopeptidase [Holophaga sp.]
MNGLLLPSWAAALGWSLLHFLWQGALLGALTLLGLRLARHRRPETRYLLGCLALASMVLAFLATFAWIAREARPLLVLTGPHPGIAQGPGLVDRIRPWLPWVLAGWACGSAVLGLRMAAGLCWLYGPCLRRAQPAPRPWADRLERLRDLLGCTRPVRLLLSDLVDSPLVVGFYRAVILVPASAFTALPPEALEAILAHELSHVRRWDFLVNFVQNLAEILLFFHPALWWVSRQVRREREHCCDDAAILACGDRLRYAEALAALEALRPSPPTDIRLAPAGHGGALVNRIRRILTACPPTLTLTRPGILALAAATALGAGTRMATAIPVPP